MDNTHSSAQTVQRYKRRFANKKLQFHGLDRLNYLAVLISFPIVILAVNLLFNDFTFHSSLHTAQRLVQAASDYQKSTGDFAQISMEQLHDHKLLPPVLLTQSTAGPQTDKVALKMKDVANMPLGASWTFHASEDASTAYLRMHGQVDMKIRHKLSTALGYSTSCLDWHCTKSTQQWNAGETWQHRVR